MTHTSGHTRSEGDTKRRIAGQISVVELRVERARRMAITAQRSAAASLSKSAEAHERMAKSYEERAEHGLFRDNVDREEDLDHAARHQQFAHEDRRMAQRSRGSAEMHLADCNR